MSCPQGFRRNSRSTPRVRVFDFSQPRERQYISSRYPNHRSPRHYDRSYVRDEERLPPHGNPIERRDPAPVDESYLSDSIPQDKSDSPSYRDSKKINFTSFLKTFSTMVAQARENEADLQLLKDAMGDIVYEKQKESENGLLHRLEAVENSLVMVSNVSARLSNIEAHISSSTSRIAAVEERLSSMTSCAVCSKPPSDSQEHPKKCHGDEDIRLSDVGAVSIRSEADILERLSKLENNVSDVQMIHQRLDSVENKIQAMETTGSTQTEMTDNVMELELQAETTTDQDTSTVESSATNTKKRKKPNPVERKEVVDQRLPEMIRFSLDSNDFVVVHIDGVGCRDESGPSGIRIWFGDDHPLNISRPLFDNVTTKSALLAATQIAVDIALEAGIKKLHLMTSNEFLIQCLYKLQIWHDRKWRKKSGEPFKHVDQLRKMHKSISSIHVIATEVADNMARSLADLSIVTIKTEKV